MQADHSLNGLFDQSMFIIVFDRKLALPVFFEMEQFLFFVIE